MRACEREHACPDCGMAAGVPCVTKSGKRARDAHGSRRMKGARIIHGAVHTWDEIRARLGPVTIIGLGDK